MRAPGRQHGFSLLEVVVAMVITAVGLAGYLGLQAVSLKSNRTALQRSYATMYAYDIVDSMRANSSAAIAGAYDLDFDETAQGGTVAGNDLVTWTAILASNLPNGEGQTAVDGSGNATVQIRWNESVNSSSTLTFTTQSSL